MSTNVKDKSTTIVDESTLKVLSSTRCLINLGDLSLTRGKSSKSVLPLSAEDVTLLLISFRYSLYYSRTSAANVNSFPPTLQTVLAGKALPPLEAL